MRHILRFTLTLFLFAASARAGTPQEDLALPPELIKLLPPPPIEKIESPKKTAKKKKKEAPKNLLPFELTNLFSTDENPGSGSVTFSRGINSIEIKLGKEGGNNGYGLIFRSETLPQPHRYEFHNQKIVQIAIGAAEGQNRSSQVLMLGLLLEKLPEKRTVFNVIERKKRSLASKVNEGVLALLVSPELKKDASEQEKLANTWFTKTGAVTAITKSAVKKSTSYFNGKRLEFGAQLVEMDLNLEMATPFNPNETTTLKGKLIVPIYWPTNDAAKRLTDELAALSLDESR